MNKVSIFLMCIAVSACSTTNTISQSGDKRDLSPKILLGSAKNETSIIQNEAFSSYNEKYTKAAKHKAFAQSAAGAWSWKADRTSKEHAATSALIGCQAQNKDNEKRFPCQIINIDGVWVGE